jgi:hypothetical protein
MQTEGFVIGNGPIIEFTGITIKGRKVMRGGEKTKKAK